MLLKLDLPSKVSMGVQLAYNVVRRTPVTTYAEIAPWISTLFMVAAWELGMLARGDDALWLVLPSFMPGLLYV